MLSKKLCKQHVLCKLYPLVLSEETFWFQYENIQMENITLYKRFE